MTTRPEAEIDQLLVASAVEFADEERSAAEEESSVATASAVFSVRLPPDIHEAVKVAASRAHTTPSALIRRWVSERVEQAADPAGLTAAVAILRRDVERVADLIRPA
ncbi:MAG: hypothetical protein M3Z25_08740 [Actinomycetota bacterium]|nr:hypothetical protein [Actinomycetota bacterium]